ncbi:5195_t:CDS:2, partial [Acaulospora colombiana]
MFVKHGFSSQVTSNISTDNKVSNLEVLRSDPKTQFIPVILLSAGESIGVEVLEEADDYLVKPFCAMELIIRVRANIKLSRVRRKYLLQQKWQSETREILSSISYKIRSGFDTEEVLASAVKQIHRILPSDRVFIINTNSDNHEDYHIMALSSTDPNEHNLMGKRIDSVIGEKDVDPSNAHMESIAEVYQRLQFSNESIMVDTKVYSRLVESYVSTIFTPIRTNSSSIWGWLFAYRSPNSTWSDSEKEFIEQSSVQIGLAITHSMLVEEKLKKEAQMEAAKAANEAKVQILNKTSHELRTPLGAIIGVLSAFEDTPLTDDQKEMVHIMMRASDIVLSVVNDILDAAKLEAQKMILANKTFDLPRLVDETLNILGEKAGNKKIELIVCCDHTLPRYVKSDPD